MNTQTVAQEAIIDFAQFVDVDLKMSKPVIKGSKVNVTPILPAAKPGTTANEIYVDLVNKVVEYHNCWHKLWKAKEAILLIDGTVIVGGTNKEGKDMTARYCMIQKINGYIDGSIVEVINDIKAKVSSPYGWNNVSGNIPKAGIKIQYLNIVNTSSLVK